MTMFAIKLERNKKIHKFYVSVSDESNSVKYCKLNRNMFKAHLQKRYGKKLSDRMLLFIDTNYGILLRTPYDVFSKFLKDFVRGGSSVWRKFAFHVFNISGNEKLCEHDLFQILELFKSLDPIQFFKQIYSQPKISSYYREAIDESDNVFFDAFCQDFSLIAHACNLKKAK